MQNSVSHLPTEQMPMWQMACLCVFVLCSVFGGEWRGPASGGEGGGQGPPGARQR